MLVILVLDLMVFLAIVGKAEPMGTAWTYQGRLIDTNDPGDGLYDFQFKLFNEPNGTGVHIPQLNVINDIDVIDGYFTVELDFGSSVFNGDARWLEVLVRSGDSNDVNDYVTLSPRQEVTPTPYALHTRGIFVDSSLNVGIGTTTPKQNVTIQAARPRIGLVEDGGDAAVLEFHEQENQLRLQYWTDYGNAWIRDMMVFDGDTGRVGIGTTSPYRRLTVDEGGLSVYTGSSGEDVYFSIGSMTVANSGEDPMLEIEDSPFDRITLFNHGSEVMTIRDQGVTIGYGSSTPPGNGLTVRGNVGIGTSSPGRRLTVNEGGVEVHTGSSGEDVSFSSSSVVVTNSGEDPMLEIDDSPFDRITLFNHGSEVMTIRDQGVTIGYGSSTPPGNGLTVKGNVGIGTANPEAKLHVEGGLRIGSEPNSVKIQGMFLLTGESVAINDFPVPFPDGYTSSNSMVLSAEVKGQVGWWGMGFHPYNYPTNESDSLHYMLLNDSIRIYLPDTGFNAIKPYRILLMKFK